MPLFSGTPLTTDGSIPIEFISPKRALWSTDTDWNKGNLGSDIEVNGTGASAVIRPNSYTVYGTNIYLNWKLNETSGTVASDSSQYNRPGTLMTVSEFLNPSQWITGKLNNAISNPGEYEAVNYISGGDIAGFEYTQPFSIECWFNHTPGYDVSLAGNYDSEDGKGWCIYIQEDYLRFDLRGGGDNYVQVYTNEKVTTNTWQHLVITYNGNGAASGVKFYLDGVLLTTNVYYDGLNSTSIIPAVNDFHLMAVMDTGWGWIGQVDEFTLYTKVLTQTDVDTKYNSGNGTETPLETGIHYKIAAHYETNVFDSSIPSLIWGTLGAIESLPSGTTLEIKTRASNNSNSMGSYGLALNVGDSLGVTGQFIQFSVDFTGTTTERSILEYIGALYTAPTIQDIAP